MRKRNMIRGGLIGAALTMTIAAVPAAGQSISALEARIAKLESEAAETSKQGSVTTTTGVDLTFYGFVRADAFRDSDYAIGNNSSGFGSITGASSHNSSFGTHAYQSRFGVRGATETAIGKLKFNLEADFYGSGGGVLRLRHAFGEVAGFTFGQTNSNFNGEANADIMLDLNGLLGRSGYRAVQLRYTAELAEGLTGSVSLEDDSATWRARPNATVALKYVQGKTNAKLSLLSRRIDSLAGSQADAWGVTLSGSASLWNGGLVTASVVTGSGISSLMSLGGHVGQQSGQTAVKATYDLDVNGNTIDMTGFGLGIAQQLGQNLTVSATTGQYDYDSFAGATATSMDKLRLSTLTLRYNPAKAILLGLEYQRYQQELLGGGKLDNDRILAVAQFSF